MDIASGIARLRGKHRRYLALLREMSAGHRDDMKRLQAALRAGDDATALRIAHSLKGAAGQLGITGLAEAARGLETGLRGAENPDPADLRPLCDAVDAKLQRLAALLGGT